jgi:hypothetical protein
MMQPDSIVPLPGAAGLALPVDRQSPPTSRFGGRHPLHDTDPATRSLRNDPADARRRGEKFIGPFAAFAIRALNLLSFSAQPTVLSLLFGANTP